MSVVEIRWNINQWYFHKIWVFTFSYCYKTEQISCALLWKLLYQNYCNPASLVTRHLLRILDIQLRTCLKWFSTREIIVPACKHTCCNDVKGTSKNICRLADKRTIGQSKHSYKVHLMFFLKWYPFVAMFTLHALQSVPGV